MGEARPTVVFGFRAAGIMLIYYADLGFRGGFIQPVIAVVSARSRRERGEPVLPD